MKGSDGDGAVDENNDEDDGDASQQNPLEQQGRSNDWMRARDADAVRAQNGGKFGSGSKRK